MNESLSQTLHIIHRHKKTSMSMVDKEAKTSCIRANNRPTAGHCLKNDGGQRVISGGNHHHMGL